MEMKEKEALAGLTSILSLSEAEAGTLVPILEEEVDEAGETDLIDSEELRAALLRRIDEELRRMENEALEDAGKQLLGFPHLEAFRAIDDFFKEWPRGAFLYVMNSEKPVQEIERAIEALAGISRFSTIALLSCVSRKEIEYLAGVLGRQATRGVFVQVLAPVPPGSYEELLRRYEGDGCLLGSAPGFDQIQVFPDRAFDPDRDPFCALPRPVIGAYLGRRLWLDAEMGIGEPLVGDRGGIGVLRCGKLVSPFLEGERAELARRGLTVLRRWPGVGEVVVEESRTLAEGETPYAFPSPVRVRLQIQATFHETAEHLIRGRCSGDKRALESAARRMNAFLDGMKERGWIEDGRVTFSYRRSTLQIDVRLAPCPPISRIDLIYHEIVTI